MPFRRDVVNIIIRNGIPLHPPHDTTVDFQIVPRASVCRNVKTSCAKLLTSRYYGLEVRTRPRCDGNLFFYSERDSEKALSWFFTVPEAAFL
jgi:hypothetical protein